MNGVEPNGLTQYVGWEGHFIGGYGETSVFCCDETGKKWIHRYRKVCLGAAAEASGGVPGKATVCFDWLYTSEYTGEDCDNCE